MAPKDKKVAPKGKVENKTRVSKWYKADDEPTLYRRKRF